MRVVDPRHDALGPPPRLGEPRCAGARQAFHRRCRRQGQPRAGADRCGLRWVGADDFGPRARPDRRHARQARRDPGLLQPARHRNLSSRCCRGGLRHHWPDRRSGPGGPAPLRRSRRHRDGRIDPADHRLDPVEEAGGGTRGTGDGRQGRERRVHDRARRRPGAGPIDRRRSERGRSADPGADHRHEPGARPDGGERARGARGDRAPDRRGARCPPRRPRRRVGERNAAAGRAGGRP